MTKVVGRRDVSGVVMMGVVESPFPGSLTWGETQGGGRGGDDGRQGQQGQEQEGEEGEAWQGAVAPNLSSLLLSSLIHTVFEP